MPTQDIWAKVGWLKPHHPPVPLRLRSESPSGHIIDVNLESNVIGGPNEVGSGCGSGVAGQGPVTTLWHAWQPG